MLAESKLRRNWIVRFAALTHSKSVSADVCLIQSLNKSPVLPATRLQSRLRNLTDEISPSSFKYPRDPPLLRLSLLRRYDWRWYNNKYYCNKRFTICQKKEKVPASPVRLLQTSVPASPVRLALVYLTTNTTPIEKKKKLIPPPLHSSHLIAGHISGHLIAALFARCGALLCLSCC